MALARRKILAEMLNRGYGTQAIPADSGGTQTGNKIGIHTFNSGAYPNVQDYGAVLDGTTDDATAFADALAAHKAVYVPGNKTARIGQTLDLGSGQCLFSDGMTDRWRSGITRAKLDFRGTTAAIRVKTTSSGQVIDSVKLLGIQVDGTNVSGNVDGLLLQADTGGADAVELVHVEDCAFTNFPRYQVRVVRTVFRGVFRSCSFHNSGRSADHLIAFNYDGTAGAPGQFTFDDCFAAQYTAAKWCLFAGRDATWTVNAVSDILINGGTWGPAATGAGGHGIWVNGGLQIYGAHIENFTESAQSATIGIRYTGNNGAVIAPATCSYFGTGLEIGDSTSTSEASRGCTVLNGVGFNLTTGRDINIIGTGDRRGTVIMPMGYFGLSGDFGTSNGLIQVTNSAANPSDVFHMKYLSGAGGTYLKLGSQLHLDDVDGRVGFGIFPDVRFEVRAANNDGIRLVNSSNSDAITAQILNVSSVGQVLLYNSSASNRAILNGDGTTAFSTTGSAAVATSALMTLDSTTSGLLPPRMTTTQRDLVGTPPTGLQIYNTTTKRPETYNGAAWAPSGFTSGTSSSISTGGTVTHGLGTTPTTVMIVPTDATPTAYYVSAKGATTFTVTFSGGGSHVFDWIAIA